MCIGLALGIKKDLTIDCKGLSSHAKSGLDQGKHLKLELIVNNQCKEGYELLLDEGYNNRNIGPFEKFVTSDFKNLHSKVKKTVMAWIRNNETQVLRWLLFCNIGMKAGGDQDMSSCEAGGNQYMSYCSAGKNQYMNSCKAGKNQDMRYCEAGGDQYMSSCKVGENQYMNSCKAGENQDMSYCSAGKNQYMNSCEAGENQYMSFCKAGRDQYMSYCSAKRRYVSYMHSANKGNNDFIDMLSNKAKDGLLDWDYLVELARKGYNQ